MQRSRRLLAALACALGACAPPAHQPAIDLATPTTPTAADFSSESTLAMRMPDLQRAWDAGEDGFFEGVQGVRVHYRIVRATTPTELGAVVVLPGRTEPAQKYVEVATDLVRQGYSAYVLDHRGQGASGRMTANPQQGHVEFFRDYVDDLETFLTRIVRRDPHAKVFVLAHSMGGAVAALHMNLHPGGFDAAVLTAPMLEVATGAFPAIISASLGETACGTTSGSGYAIGQQDYVEETTVATSDVTHSTARWQNQIDMLRANTALRLGGVTWRWLCESLSGADRASRVGAASTTPTLLFQAGADDVVNPGGQVRYCTAAPRCQLVVVPGAFHEILMERDELRNGEITQIVRFFNHFAMGGT
ncbi:MAG: alpha/beta fold hydrolase [Deltaproteobacteria bacterium]